MVRPLTQLRKLERLGLRRLSRTHLALAERAAFRNQLAQLTGPVAEALGARLGQPVELEAQLLDAAPHGPQSLGFPAVFAVLSLDGAGAQMLAEVEPALASALVDRLAGGPGECSAPLPITEVEQAGLSLLILEALAALRKTEVERHLAPRFLRLVLSAAELSPLHDLRTPHLAIRIRVAYGPASGTVRLLIPTVAVRSWVESAAPDALAPAAEVAAAGLPFAVIAGRAELSARDFCDLVLGDVVLLGELERNGEALCGPARLVGTGFALQGRIGPDGFGFERATLPQERVMSEQQTQIVSAPALPVEIEVELARVRLTIAELGALQPGGVIPLRIGAGEPVTLRLGDSKVAIAELVDIDGEIGARILRLCK